MLSLQGRYAWMVGPARPPRTAADAVRALPGLIGLVGAGPAVLVVEGVGLEESLADYLGSIAIEPQAELEPGTDDTRAMVVHVPLSEESAARLAWALTLAGPDAAGQSVQVYTAGEEPELLVYWPGFPAEPMVVAGRVDEEVLAAWAVPLKCAVERVDLR